MGPAAWIGPAIIAAAIAALINVVGWFVTFRQARLLEHTRRAEKVTDVQTALLAEVRSDLHHLAGIDVGGEIEKMRALMEEATTENPYTPFVPKDAGSIVFSAVVREIAVLPTPVIDPIVLYYKQKEAIGHLAEDLRAESFRSLPNQRKLAMMRDYLRIRAFAADLASDAIAALEASLGLPASSRALGQLARQSASVGSGASENRASSHPSSPSI